jgi:hypothetical protein
MLLYISEIGEFWCKSGVGREHNRCYCKLTKYLGFIIETKKSISIDLVKVKAILD